MELFANILGRYLEALDERSSGTDFGVAADRVASPGFKASAYRLAADRSNANGRRKFIYDLQRLQKRCRDINNKRLEGQEKLRNMMLGAIPVLWGFGLLLLVMGETSGWLHLGVTGVLLLHTLYLRHRNVFDICRAEDLIRELAFLHGELNARTNR